MMVHALLQKSAKKGIKIETNLYKEGGPRLFFQQGRVEWISRLRDEEGQLHPHPRQKSENVGQFGCVTEISSRRKPFNVDV
jgi:hypothetical protein